MKKPRMKVELENFHSTELSCKCGCGKQTHPHLAVRLQAFIYQLEVIYRTSVRCIVHSGARCKKDHARVSKDKTSYHMGLTRLDEGDGAAVDCHFERLIIRNGKNIWAIIDKNEIAHHAIKSNLFGGVGWKSYPEDWVMIHLDMGGVRTW